MNSERRINNLAGNQIVFRRGFSHLGALALNWNGASPPNCDIKAQKFQRECQFPAPTGLSEKNLTVSQVGR